MTKEELIKAMDNSKEVRWKNDAYLCYKDKNGQYLLTYMFNDYTIGIFHRNGIGMNLVNLLSTIINNIIIGIEMLGMNRIIDLMT